MEEAPPEVMEQIRRTLEELGIKWSGFPVPVRDPGYSVLLALPDLCAYARVDPEEDRDLLSMVLDTACLVRESQEEHQDLERARRPNRQAQALDELRERMDAFTDALSEVLSRGPDGDALIQEFEQRPGGGWHEVNERLRLLGGIERPRTAENVPGHLLAALRHGFLPVLREAVVDARDAKAAEPRLGGGPRLKWAKSAARRLAHSYTAVLGHVVRRRPGDFVYEEAAEDAPDPEATWDDLSEAHREDVRREWRRLNTAPLEQCSDGRAAFVQGVLGSVGESLGDRTLRALINAEPTFPWDAEWRPFRPLLPSLEVLLRLLSGEPPRQLAGGVEGEPIETTMLAANSPDGEGS